MADPRWFSVAARVLLVTGYRNGAPTGFSGTVQKRRREAPRYLVRFMQDVFPGAPGKEHWVDHDALQAEVP